MISLPQLLPVSTEYLSLCQGQLKLLAQGVGADWSIVYLAQPDPANQEIILTPISVFPDRLLGPGEQEETLVIDTIFNSVDWTIDDVEERYSDFSASSSQLNRGKNATGFPLRHENLVLGILVTGRRRQPWRSPEIKQIKLVAESLVIACVLDQQKSWATQRLGQQEHLMGLELEHFHDLLHQLRNPTMAISTFGKLLLKRLSDEDPNYGVVEGIVRESDRLKALLSQFGQEVEALESQDIALPPDNILALPPEPQSSELIPQHLSLKPVNVMTVINPLLASVEAIAHDRGLAFSTAIPEEPTWVMADPVALVEVLNNLLENAMKYTPTGGQLSLHIIQNEQDLSIAVHDTGCGISQADLPHIFERHYRGRQSNGPIDGTGLGLAIAADLVEQLGGDIEVYSPTIGLPYTEQCPGSTFLLWLRLAPSDSASTEIDQK